MGTLTFLESTIKMPLMELPVRTVIARLKTGTVILSPGSKLNLQSWQGTTGVTAIVAPNLFHMGGISKTMISFPQAKVWGVPGAKELRPHIHWQGILGQEEWPYHQELLPIAIGGMPKINEYVFFHTESRSLIVTDLCFNLLGQRGLGARMILGMFGTYNRFGISKFFLKHVKDQTAFRKSMQQVLELDFQQILVSHGANLQGHSTDNARKFLRKALAERGF